MAMEFLSLGKVVICCFLLWGMILVKGQPSTEGYISIDCGISSGHSYKDPVTGLEYISDDQFTDTGKNYNIAANYNNSDVTLQNQNLRSFPDGNRNCYTLKPVIQYNKYLLRASFMYGNYDGLRSVQNNNPILFDLHIGVNFWEKVNISEATGQYTSEAITVAMADFIQVCLVNTGAGTPFISSLEMRPLKSNLYPAANASQSIVLFVRRNIAPNKTPVIRYPDDPHDRIWYPLLFNVWTGIETTNDIRDLKNDIFQVPVSVLQTGAVPTNSSSPLEFSLHSENINTNYYIFLHFCEIQQLTASDKREFNIYLNGNLWFGAFGAFSPPSLSHSYVYSVVPSYGYADYTYSLRATANSTLPPLINGLEIYSLMLLTEMMTNLGDVEAITAIRKQYQMKRNWMGDPCTPKDYAWDGVTCTSGVNSTRIIALNLSSSGLTGQISASFSKLTAITSLDLSYNKLNGTIPDFLANLSSLAILNLTGNCFTEPIPDVLQKKSADGSLILRTDNSTNKCGIDFPPEPKKKILTTPIIVIISVVPVVLLALAVAICIMLISKRRQQVLVSDAPVRQHVMEVPARKMDPKEHEVQHESKQFTYLQLENITNKFTRVIGQGGFGTVYHGYMDGDTEVAVKLLSGWSTQGMKEFMAETQNLRNVRHRNLVSLVGYCNDGEHMAIVYEYLPEGSLNDYLRGKTGLARPLSWRERLQIVLEAAQGLDYLHKGCNRSIIHRDVKTSNILLGPRLEAKIADFGLSKAVLSDAQFVSTVAIVGTPGYMDPEYHKTLKLSEKSDVYSFGIVLLEIITGEPPIVKGARQVHILERVKPMLDRGDIEEIIDRRIRGKCDINSVWKVLDIAMMCTKIHSIQRPTMAEVMIHLKESLEMEISFVRSENLYSEDTSINETRSAFGDISVNFVPSAR